MKRRDLFRGAGLSLLLSSGASAQTSRSQEPAPPASSFENRGRRMVMDLSGRWQLHMDDKDAGVRDRWFAKRPGASPSRSFDVVVPSVWQQYVDLQGGVGWYYKDLQISSGIVGKILRLRFEAVDYRARVWLNGREAGTHDGGFTPFELDVSRLAKAGANQLAVRVSDVGRD